ncbi:MAG TPA: tetratricopeptide repeat protein [Polyangiaceae bacterium]
MRCALFFLIVACGSAEPASRHVEIETAQPLPSVSETPSATPTTTVSMQVEPRDVDDVRDLRHVVRRSPALLRTETQALENLLAATAASSTDRPALLRRLAENYSDLRKQGEAGASAKAIHHYSELVRTYPTYAQIDEAYYYLALEYELAGDLSNARRSYYELIKNSPSSKYVPYAYFAFGEIFFHEAKSDPSKWDLAKQSYTEVLKFPSPIASDAACRLGLVFDAQGDPKRAAAVRSKAERPCGG